MTVVELWTGGQRFSTTGIGYATTGEIQLEGANVMVEHRKALRECLTARLLCTDSQLQADDGHGTVHGDPTEGALLFVAAKAGLDEAAEQCRLPRIDVLPFESEHRYMATLHDGHVDGPRTVFV